MENIAMSVKVFPESEQIDRAVGVLNKWKMGTSWGEDAPEVTSSDVVWGAEFVSMESDIDDVSRDLEKAGVAHWARQEAKGDVDGAVRGFAPEFGAVELGSDQHGEVTVRAKPLLMWLSNMDFIIGHGESQEATARRWAESSAAFRRALGGEFIERYSL